MIVELTPEEEEALIDAFKDTPEDMVNAPKHYQSEAGIQCWEAQIAAVGRDGYVAHCRATAIKYCWRAGDKDPRKEAEDLRKAAWYLQKAAELIEQ